MYVSQRYVSEEFVRLCQQSHGKILVGLTGLADSMGE